MLTPIESQRNFHLLWTIEPFFAEPGGTLTGVAGDTSAIASAFHSTLLKNLCLDTIRSHKRTAALFLRTGSGITNDSSMVSPGSIQRCRSKTPITLGYVTGAYMAEH